MIFEFAADAVRSIIDAIENDGFERFDSKYISNVSFILSEDFSSEGLLLAREAKIDFDWSWDAANGRYSPAPEGSYYRQRFGDDVRPYGDVWNIPQLLQRLREPGERRRAVLYNGDEACVMCSQFWVRENELEMTVSMRSSDVVGMLSLDIQYFRQLQMKICGLTGFTPGQTIYNIGNAHILK